MNWKVGSTSRLQIQNSMLKLQTKSYLFVIFTVPGARIIHHILIIIYFGQTLQKECHNKRFQSFIIKNRTNITYFRCKERVAILPTQRYVKICPIRFSNVRNNFLHIWRNLWSIVKIICEIASRPKNPQISAGSLQVTGALLFFVKFNFIC